MCSMPQLLVWPLLWPQHLCSGEGISATSFIHQTWLSAQGGPEAPALWGGEEREGSLNTWNPSFMQH